MKSAKGSWRRQRRAELAVVNIAKLRAAVAAKKKEDAEKDQHMADANEEKRNRGAE